MSRTAITLIITCAAVLTAQGCPTPIPSEPTPPARYLARAAGGYVFFLVPDLDEIVRIDPAGLGKTVIHTGHHPITMDASADGSRLIVLNAASHSVSVVNTGTGTASVIPVRFGANAVAVSPTGRFAIAYLDLNAAGYEPVVGVLNLNEITLVDTVNLTAVPVVLSFDPSRVAFTPSEGQAVVLSRSQAALVSTAPPYTTITVPLVPDPSQFVTPSALRVSDTKAFVAVKESGDIYAIDLTSPSVNIVSMSSPPYIFELVRGGAYLLAAPAGSSSVSLIRSSDLWAVSLNLGSVPDSGSVSPDGGTAIVFSKGAMSVSILDLEAWSVRSYVLQRDAVAGAVAEGGRTALVVHSAGTTPSYLQYSVSLIDIPGATVSPIGLQSAPADFLLYDRNTAFVAMRDAGGIGVIDLQARRAVFAGTRDRPERLGALSPASGVFAVHDQPLGCVTFIDVPSMVMRSADGIFSADIYNR